jgi:hypothetical protein
VGGEHADGSERLLLRLHLLDGGSLTRIAEVYEVSQSTI